MIALTRNQARIMMIGVRFILGTISWFLPSVMARIMLLDPTSDSATAYPLQLFGARDVVLGILILDPRSEMLDQHLQLGMAMDFCDVAGAGISGLRGQLPKRSAILCFCAGLLGASLGAAALGKGPFARKVAAEGVQC